jgi:uncharacterized protein
MKKLILILLLVPNIALAAPNFPPQDGYITDAANIISETKEQELEAQLTQLDTTKGIQIALVTVTNLKDYPIRDYALELGRKWGVGIKDADSGIVFLASIEDREMTIEVGYGLEGALTDIETNYIIQNLTQYFQAQNYDNAFQVAANEITNAIQEENFVAARQNNASETADSIISIGIFSIIILSWLASILGRSKSIIAGGIIGSVSGLLLGLFISGIYAISATIILGLFGLFFDYIVSKNYHSKKNTSWWAGGNHNWWDGPGGGSSGGGGFGGFSGGSFGGGGSSGRW